MADEDNLNGDQTPEEAGTPEPEPTADTGAAEPDPPESGGDKPDAPEPPAAEPQAASPAASDAAPPAAEASAPPEARDAAASPPATEPATAPPKASESNVTPLSIGQDELDAMMGVTRDGGGDDAAPSSIDQNELDAMVQELTAEASAAAQPNSAAAGGGEADIMAEMEAAIAAEKAAADGNGNGPPNIVGGAVNGLDPNAAESYGMPDFENGDEATALSAIDMLDDVELNVKIELGRTEMYIEDVLQLGVGTIVELNKLAGDPVDIFVNEQLIARGEVLVLNDNFCVRINDILCPVSEVGPTV